MDPVFIQYNTVVCLVFSLIYPEKPQHLKKFFHTAQSQRIWQHHKAGGYLLPPAAVYIILYVSVCLPHAFLAGSEKYQFPFQRFEYFDILNLVRMEYNIQKHLIGLPGAFFVSHDPAAACH